MGIATGAAMVGARPIIEVMFGDFLTLVMDQLVNHAAKIHFMSGGASGFSGAAHRGRRWRVLGRLIRKSSMPGPPMCRPEGGGAVHAGGCQGADGQPPFGTTTRCCASRTA